MKVCLACAERFVGDDWRCPRCGEAPVVRDGYRAFAPELAARNDGFGEEYFAMLAPVEADNFWFRSRNRLLQWALQRFFSDARTFLEIGCGTGYVLAGMQNAFPRLRCCGSDIFTRGLAFAAQRLREAELFQMDARRIPFVDEFDVIGLFDVLEHIEEDGLALAQMFQAVQPGGGILLTVPQHPFLWSAQDEFGCHKRRYTRRELVTKVRGAGFAITWATSFVSLLLPLMMISRLRRRHTTDGFDQMAEFKISQRVNTALERVLAIERAAITRNLSLPAGGSLLLVARRP